MLAVLKLEYIGENYAAMFRSVGQARLIGKPWVARLTGLDPVSGYQREFVQGEIDYREANGIGSRGVYLYFVLDPGIYEVKERVSWKRSRRYFVRCNGRDIDEIDEEEAREWLSKG